ncbi:MAG: carboxypeptidase regulatory-like domain-containing protein [Desulfobulbaceae bacterium]
MRAIKAPLHPLQAKEEDAALWIGYPDKRGGLPPRQPQAPAPDRVSPLSMPVGAMPATSVNFEGLNNIAGVYPPDTCGDVGPNHYVQITNLYFRVFDKAGTALTPALANNSLWAGFGGVCETTNHGDPIVLYDQFSDRWLLSQFSIGGPFHQCIAISKTGNPTGEWYLYDYEMSTTIMNDYPKFGVWPDGYYMTINQFDSTSGLSWAGQGAVAFDRNAMLTGSPAPMVYFDMASNSALGGMLPADADGATAPPPGTPNYFAQFDDDAWGYAADQLEIYEFHVDWAAPANSTFTESAVSPLAVAPFNTLNTPTIPQPGTAQLLDNLGDRLMYRLQYRNFGSHQTMVVNHTVDTTGTGAGVAGIRWYELRDSGAGWTIQQQSTYSGDSANSDHRWMGSMAMDSQGNMALGYSVASATTYPSIRYAGRLAGDAANTLGQGEQEVIAGTGSQTGSAARWGDYSMMSVDPADDCTFWYTQEYYQTTSTAGWQTRVAAFRFPGCTAGSSGVLEGTVSDAGAAPLGGAIVTADDGAGVQVSTTTAADGTYGFAALPAGTYTVTAEKFGYTTDSMPGVTVAAGTTTIQDFVLAEATMYTLSGTVTDAGTGWPVYAEIDYGHGTVWTDPVTGSYSVELPEGTYSVTAAADKYDTAGATVPLNSNGVQDFALQADATCSAPGYKSAALLTEGFNGCTLPVGWTANNLGGDCVWDFTDPGSRGNLTGGAGCFAVADSDYCGSGKTMDTELVAPSVDCSGLSAVTLEFKYDVNDYGNVDRFDVDVSTDGGSTWINVWQRLGVDDRGPKTAAVDITSIAAGQADVVVRFQYLAPDWDWWWQVYVVWIY